MNEFQIKNVTIDMYNYGEETLSKKTIYRNALDCASRKKRNDALRTTAIVSPCLNFYSLCSLSKSWLNF